MNFISLIMFTFRYFLNATHYAESLHYVANYDSAWRNVFNQFYQVMMMCCHSVYLLLFGTEGMELFFIIPPTDEDLYLTMWIQNPLAIENGNNTCKAKAKFLQMAPERRQKNREKREAKKASRRLKRCLTRATKSQKPLCMKVEWYLLYFTEQNSPQPLPWNVCTQIIYTRRA